jgi:hypothetical protein
LPGHLKCDEATKGVATVRLFPTDRLDHSPAAATGSADDETSNCRDEVIGKFDDL